MSESPTRLAVDPTALPHLNVPTSPEKVISRGNGDTHSPVHSLACRMYCGEEDTIPVSNPKSQKSRIPSFAAVPGHPLQRRLQTLRSRVLRLLIVRGLCAVGASVVAAAIGLGLIDFAVRFRDRGILVIFSACVLAVFAWTVYRVLVRLHGVRSATRSSPCRLRLASPP